MSSAKSYNSNDEKYYQRNLNVEKGYGYTFHSQRFIEQNPIEEEFERQKENDNKFNESENSREDYLPLKENIFQNKESIIKGILLAFIFFSVIIYSVLYMLAPEKSANLIFEGHYNTNNMSSMFDEGNGNNFYKLDSIINKKKMIIFNLSLNRYTYINISDKNLEQISLIMNKNKYPNDEIYYNIDIILKDKIIKKIGDEKDGYYNYKNYKINDFPFWLSVYNSKDNKLDSLNISSDYLMYCLNFQKDIN